MDAAALRQDVEFLGPGQFIIVMAGIIIAAPSSNAGKTTITLGLLRALRQDGVAVRGAKSGPDYIDSRFHEAASGTPCSNLDAWAMTPERIRSLAAGDGLLIIEGAMGLFDGAPPEGRGSTADLARILGLPIVLVVDAASMAQSVAPIVNGFASYDPEVKVAGVVLNRVGSERHERMLIDALMPFDLQVLGAIPRESNLVHPSRHLGLVPAQERPDLNSFIDQAAALVRANTDIHGLAALAASLPAPKDARRMPPPAQRIAIARDEAFSFAYPHLLDDWRNLGAEIVFFSPLADDHVPQADLIYLPGGYPELHAGRLAASSRFLNSLNTAAQSVGVYGECGGYMTLGEALIDSDGNRHSMAGLLPLETSFAARKLHLGYRFLSAESGPFAGRHTGHEFHYATTRRADGPTLFEAMDAEGNQLAPMGLRQGNVSGSFAHLIDVAP